MEQNISLIRSVERKNTDFCIEIPLHQDVRFYSEEEQKVENISLAKKNKDSYNDILGLPQCINGSYGQVAVCISSFDIWVLQT